MPVSTSPSPGSLARRTVLFAMLGLLLVMGIRLSFIRKVNFCGVPDSCSYFSLAETLSTRHVFQAQYVDDLQLDHVTLPSTGIEYWRPGTSFLLLLGTLGHVTLHASLIVTLFAGLLTSLAAWRIVMCFNHDRGLAALSVLLCFLLPAIWDSFLIPDSGLFYAAAVAWFLALFTVRFQGYWADILALICVAQAYLIRNDASILIIPLAVVLFLRYRAGRAASTPPPGASLTYCALIVVGFFLALAPMHIIDQAVIGKAFPSSTSRVLFFNDLNDLTIYGPIANLHTWLAAGLGRIIKLRLVTIPTIVYRIIFVLIGFGLIFVPLLCLRKRPDSSRMPLPEVAGGLTFLVTLLAVYGFVLPAIGSFSALRTVLGLLPLASVLMLVAIRSLLPPRAAGILTAAVITYYLISGVTYGKRIVADLAHEGDKIRHFADFLHAQGADPATSRVMTDNPDQMYVTTGYPSMQVPSNGPAAIAELASSLHATHLLLDTSAHDIPIAEIRSHLHPVSVLQVPNSTVLLITLPANLAP